MSDTGQQGQHGEPLIIRESMGMIWVYDHLSNLVCAKAMHKGNEDQHDQIRRELRYLVVCVNGCAGKKPEAYDDLLAACKVLLALTDPEFVEPSRGLSLRNARTIAEAAITKAEGEEPKSS